VALIQSFPPVVGTNPRILVLGSMPGKPSLQAHRYYANERNAFWPLMGDLFAAGPDLPYPQRLEKLQAAGIALWDVIATCERESSLDADIVRQSVQPNGFSAFLAVHRSIRKICFNGAAAQTYFRRLVLPDLLGSEAIEFVCLPSTSPAHAAKSYGEKLVAWSAALALPNN
jgi:hypoxanthine-DNA glycosylase